MGIWDRLGNVIKSYLNDDDTLYKDNSGRSSRQKNAAGDPDLDAAFDELNDFLNKDKKTDEKEAPKADFSAKSAGSKAYKAVPEALRPDFAELGVAFGASADECKEAYKKLLKIHHPDRHAGHEGNYKKATQKTARLNTAYDKIEQWRKGS